MAAASGNFSIRSIGKSIRTLKLGVRSSNRFSSIQFGFNVHIQSKLLFRTPVMGTHSSYLSVTFGTDAGTGFALNSRIQV